MVTWEPLVELTQNGPLLCDYSPGDDEGRTQHCPHIALITLLLLTHYVHKDISHFKLTRLMSTRFAASLISILYAKNMLHYYGIIAAFYCFMYLPLI